MAAQKARREREQESERNGISINSHWAGRTEHLTVSTGLTRIEDALASAEPGSQLANGAQAQERGAVNSWAGLAPVETRVNESISPPANATESVPQRGIETFRSPLKSAAVVIESSKIAGDASRHHVTAIAGRAQGTAVRASKRVILSMGGKGGVGKTSVMTGLAEWFEENQIPVTMLDLDTENKAIGSLAHFFAGRVPKINIHTPAGLDAFVDNLAEDTPVILADMGAGAGYVTHDWFRQDVSRRE